MKGNLTNFAKAKYFAQACSLVLHGPFLEQLFEHGRLSTIIDGLHVGAAGITLHLDEILRHPHKKARQAGHAEGLLIWYFLPLKSGGRTLPSPPLGIIANFYLTFV